MRRSGRTQIVPVNGSAKTGVGKGLSAKDSASALVLGFRQSRRAASKEDGV